MRTRLMAVLGLLVCAAGSAPHAARAADFEVVPVTCTADPCRFDGIVLPRLDRAATPAVVRPAAGPAGAVARFERPTTRYRHGVLGDAIEYEALLLERPGAAPLRFRHGDDAVFEDVSPRFADLDGDGRPELLAVTAYLARGAALSAFAPAGDRLERIAETPPLGSPNRWLDPLAVADFTGDGTRQVALVRQPHAVQRLELWRFARGTGFSLVTAIDGVSSHAIGSTVVGLSAVMDADADGVADLAVPDGAQTRLRFIRFRGGAATEIGSVALPARVGAGIVAVPAGNPRLVLVALTDRRLVIVRRRA